jgi:hypothetical protein
MTHRLRAMRPTEHMRTEAGMHCMRWMLVTFGTAALLGCGPHVAPSPRLTWLPVAQPAPTTRVLLWVDSCCVMGTPVPLDICTQHLTQQGWMTLTIVPAERQAFLARVAARDPSLANVLRAEVDLDERPVASTASQLTLQSPQWEIPTAVVPVATAPVARQPANTIFPADSILNRRDSGWIFPSDSILRRGGNDWIFPAGSILNHNP